LKTNESDGSGVQKPCSGQCIQAVYVAMKIKLSAAKEVEWLQPNNRNTE
jgi:hypothetical protein